MIGTNTAKVTAEIRDIPRTPFLRKVMKTIFGLPFLGLGLFMVVLTMRKETPSVTLISIGLALVILGAHIISAELVGKSLKFMVAFVKDIVAAVRGSKETVEPNSKTDDESGQ